MNRGLKPEERRGLMSHIVSCLQFNSLFLSLMVPRFRVFKSWRQLTEKDDDLLCWLLSR